MPKMNKANARDLYNKYQENCDRISQIADLCEKEQRERTDAETAEFNKLVQENQLLHMRMQVVAAEHLRENPNARKDAEKIIRENASRGQKTEITFVREIMLVTDVTAGGIIPLNIEDILKPLTEGFILDKVGLPMPTGLAGDYIWPMYEMAEATVLGEGAQLADSKIPFSKLTANPARIGIAIPVSNQSINQTDGLLETIVREIMPMAIRQLLNKILFSTKAVNTAAQTAGLVGPFVKAAENPVALASTPTFKQLNKDMKAKVLESGIDGEHLCWVMTKSQKAILEGEPINAKGIYMPIIQNGMMCGLPVYTTNAVRKVEKSYQKYTESNTSWAVHTLGEGETPDYQASGDSIDNALATITTPGDGKIAEVTVITEYIGLGDWRYQPMGLFGTLRFVVDPYSKARQDAVDFVLNADYATKTLRPEGFILGKVAPTA